MAFPSSSSQPFSLIPTLNFPDSPLTTPPHSRPLPSPPTIQIRPIVVPDSANSLLEPHEREIKIQLLSRPKRVSFISTWASGVEPGSPAAPSPHPDPKADSPLLSAGTQDLARRLLDFAGIQGGMRSPAPVALPARSVAAALAQPRPWQPAHAPAVSRPQLAAKLQAPTPVLPDSAIRSPASVKSPASVLSPISVSSSIALRQFRVGAQTKRPVPTRKPSARRIPPSRAPSTRRRRATHNRASRLMLIAPSTAHAPSPPSPPLAPREVFLDDDEWEFAPLVILGVDGVPDDDEWEDFDEIYGLGAPQPVTAASTDPSVYSHPSELHDPKYLVTRADEERSPVRATPPDSGARANLSAGLHSSTSPGVLSTSSASGPALLAIPARSQRRAAHLRKAVYVVSPNMLNLPASPASSRGTGPAALPVVVRRRPAPLDIPSPAPSRRFSGIASASSKGAMSPPAVVARANSKSRKGKVVVSPIRKMISPRETRQIRAAFIAASFRPAADVGAVPEKVVVPLTPEFSPTPSPKPSPRGTDKENSPDGRNGRSDAEVRGRKSRSKSPRVQLRNVWSAVSSMGSSMRSGGTKERERSAGERRAWL